MECQPRVLLPLLRCLKIYPLEIYCNIYIPQNDAIFESRDTFSKDHHQWYVEFWGCRLRRVNVFQFGGLIHKNYNTPVEHTQSAIPGSPTMKGIPS